MLDLRMGEWKASTDGSGLGALRHPALRTGQRDAQGHPGRVLARLPVARGIERLGATYRFRIGEDLGRSLQGGPVGAVKLADRHLDPFTGSHVDRKSTRLNSSH